MGRWEEMQTGVRFGFCRASSPYARTDRYPDRTVTAAEKFVKFGCKIHSDEETCDTSCFVLSPEYLPTFKLTL